MANEQIADDSQSLPVEQNETNVNSTQEEIDWKKKYEEESAMWDKRLRDKDTYSSQLTEKLKSYDKYEPTLKEIESAINQRKSQERATQLANGDINPLKEELKAELKAEQEALFSERFAGVEQLQAKAEEESIKFELSKIFTGEIKEKYGQYAWEILNTAYQQGGLEAFKAWVNQPALLLRHSKGAYVDAQEQDQSSKSLQRKTNSENHRKAMAPTARMSVTADQNESNGSLMTMPLEELEKMHVAAGGRRLNIK